VLSQIDPQGPAATIMAGIGREREQSGSALGGALANALGGLTDRESQARAGEALNVRQAQQERNKTTSAANQKILDVKNEAGTYAVSRLDEYRDARQAAALTRRGQNVTTAGQVSTATTANKNRAAENKRAADKAKADADKEEKNRQNDIDKALIAQGLDPSSGTKNPKTGKTTYKPLPGAKGGKKGGLTAFQQTKQMARISTASETIRTLMAAPGADIDEIKQLLRAGATPEKTKYQQQEIDVAVDLWRNKGKVSSSGAKILRKLGVTVPGHFERKRPPKWFENPSLPVPGAAALPGLHLDPLGG
jgi:hypothetical protein